MGKKDEGASGRAAPDHDRTKARGGYGGNAAPSTEQVATPGKGILGVPGSKNDARRCTATANRTGERCRAPAILGGTVCRMHGGALPQVKAKAKERLLALVDPALVALQKVLTDPNADDNTKVRAALGILDRTGHGPGAKIEIGGPSAFDQVTSAALDLDRSLPRGQAAEPVEPEHSWEDVDTFQRDASGKAWKELDGEDEAPYTTRLDPFDGNTVRGEVLSDSLLPDPSKAPAGPTEMTGGVTPFKKRKPTAPPRYWGEDE